MDPLQFVYRHGKGVEDVTLNILNLIHTRLKQEKLHGGILLVDFSSAFTTLQPHTTLKKLLFVFEFSPPLAMCILDFLLERTQRVRVNG